MSQTDTTPAGPTVSDPIDVPEFITETQADRVFRFLDGVSVRLEKDPTVMGPSYVHGKLKECRDFSIEVENLLVTYYDVERRVKNMLAGHKESIKARRAELMALDPWVAKGRSAADREARADMNLKSEIEALNNLKEQLVNVGYVLRAIELKREGLNRTNNDIKKQVSLMEFAKSNSYPLADDEYDDLVVQGVSNPAKGVPLDDGDEDVINLFGGDLPEPEEAPEEIHPEQAKHMADEDEGAGHIEAADDLDDFLTNLQVEDVPDLADDEDDEEVDIANLINTATETQTPKKAPAKSFDLDDEDVVDIGAFLANS